MTKIKKFEAPVGHEVFVPATMKTCCECTDMVVYDSRKYFMPKKKAKRQKTAVCKSCENDQRRVFCSGSIERGQSGGGFWRGSL